MPDGSVGSPPQDEKYVFTASRWTRGNLIFPVRIEITRHHVSRVKPRWFSTNEESIALAKVASVSTHTGLIWSEIRIDSSGGADPIVSRGHYKSDALRIREIIERLQSELSSAPASPPPSR
ncbi:MAG TPA: hypothetical protein VKU44_09155 [Terriglobia bacterium]|nr:hypothetical protein [Terriglobia bacterium]